MNINTAQARNQGFTDVFFTYDGMGDSLFLMHAAELYYQKTGKKLLIITRYDTLFSECDFVHVLSDLKTTDIIDAVLNHREHALPRGFNFHLLNTLLFRPLSDGKYATMWPDKHIIAHLCELIGMDGNITIDPCLPLTEDEKNFGRFTRYKKQIAIVSAGIWQYKLWGVENIQELINRLKKDFDFVQIGHLSDPPLAGVIDKRSKLSLRQLAATLYNSDLFVGGICGPMHLARFLGCPSVVYYSGAEPLYLASYPCNINIETRTPCLLCSQNKQDPLRQQCPRDYACVKNISVDDMEIGIRKMLSSPRPQKLKTETIKLNPCPKPGLAAIALGKKLHTDDALKRPGKKITITYLFGIPVLKRVKTPTCTDYYLFSRFNCHHKQRRKNHDRTQK